MESPSSKYLVHKGLKSHYVDWSGDGPTALLVHGGMRTSRSFDAMARRLNQSAHVLALDLIGHGDSTWLEEGYTYEDRATDIHHFITQTGLENVCGIGHSMGGTAISILAEKNPERFDKLILMEPVMQNDTSSREMLASRQERPRRTYENLDELRELLSKALAI